MYCKVEVSDCSYCSSLRQASTKSDSDFDEISTAQKHYDFDEIERKNITSDCRTLSLSITQFLLYFNVVYSFRDWIEPDHCMFIVICDHFVRFCSIC